MPSSNTKIANRIEKHFESKERVNIYPDIYTELDEMSSWSSAFATHRQELIFRKVSPQLEENARVLEVGCGIGELTASFQSQGINCLGIDQSAKMVALARERIHEKGLPINCVEQADLYAFEPKHLFDAVIANGVIPYYKDQKSFIIKLMSYVKPGGVIAITHRNALFNLACFNKGTLDFLFDEVFGAIANPIALSVKSNAAKSIPSLNDEQKKSISNKVFRSAENPMDVDVLYKKSGLLDIEISYTFIHPAPPRFTDHNINGKKVYEFSMQLEDRWQGAFCGSQFLVVSKCLQI